MSQSGWSPLLFTTERKELPEVGDIIALSYRAWEVVAVHEREGTPEEQAALQRIPTWGREKYAPYDISLRRLYGPKHHAENDRREVGRRVGPLGYDSWKVYPEGRVPLCSCCQHPWPCLMVTAAKDAKEQGKVLDEKLTRSKPGCCYSCGEVISTRQKAFTYPEGNVELPGFPPPSFHLRNSCADGRRHYDLKRAKLLPDAVPVLQTDPEQPTIWGETGTTTTP